MIANAATYGAMKDRVSAALDAALARRDVDVVASAYPYFIPKGTAAAVDLLAAGLPSFGTREMALEFLNCGNKSLEDAARRWADSHGLKVEAETAQGRGYRWGGR
jgi:hypothetical protein